MLQYSSIIVVEVRSFFLNERGAEEVAAAALVVVHLLLQTLVSSVNEATPLSPLSNIDRAASSKTAGVVAESAISLF